MKKSLKLLICSLLLSAAAATAAGCAKTADEGVLIPVSPHGGASMPEGSANQKGEDIPTPQPPAPSILPTDEEPAGNADNGNPDESGDNENNGDEEEPEEAKTYFVIFTAENFKYRASYTTADESVAEPDVPQKEGYTARWKSYELTYGDDVCVEAEYELNVYDITFKTDGGEINLTYTFFDEAVKEPAVPAKKGYTRGRWAEYELTYGEKVTVTAEYDLVIYSVTFIAGDFKKTLTYSVENGEITEPEVPEKRGYIGGKWQNYELSFDGDITVYAEYTPLPATPDGEFGWKLEDGGYTVTGYYGSDGEIIIPSTHEGLPVTKIGSAAFMQNLGIRAVVMGENVRVIDNNAFYYCTNLASVALNEKLESINNTAFANTAISELKIPAALTNIGRQAFFSTKIKALNIPDTVKTLGDSAFCACEELLSVIIGDGIEEIPKSTFDRCAKLESVVIGKNVKSIRKRAFAECISLKTAVFLDTANWYANSVETSQYNVISDQITDEKRAAEILSGSISTEFSKSVK